MGVTQGSTGLSTDSIPYRSTNVEMLTRARRRAKQTQGRTMTVTAKAIGAVTMKTVTASRSIAEQRATARSVRTKEKRQTAAATITLTIRRTLPTTCITRPTRQRRTLPRPWTKKLRALMLMQEQRRTMREGTVGSPLRMRSE